MTSGDTLDISCFPYTPKTLHHSTNQLSPLPNIASLHTCLHHFELWLLAKHLMKLPSLRSSGILIAKSKSFLIQFHLVDCTVILEIHSWLLRIRFSILGPVSKILYRWLHKLNLFRGFRYLHWTVSLCISTYYVWCVT